LIDRGRGARYGLLAHATSIRFVPPSHRAPDDRVSAPELRLLLPRRPGLRSRGATLGSLILREIMVGYHRFNEIRQALPLISPSMLSRRLKSLEDDGVIRRQSDTEGITYALTEAGEGPRPIVDALGHWAKRWVTRDYESYDWTRAC